MEFADKHNLTEPETNTLLRMVEKEGLELVNLEELDSATADIHDFEKEDRGASLKIWANWRFFWLRTSRRCEVSAGDDEGVEKEAVRETAGATQITDGVKSYLRDIGKIPLLNKKTETDIADRIAAANVNPLTHCHDSLLFTKNSCDWRAFRKKYTTAQRHYSVHWIWWREFTKAWWRKEKILGNHRWA